MTIDLSPSTTRFTFPSSLGAALLTLGFATACAGGPEPPSSTGAVRVALRTTLGETSYELRDASFEVAGPSSATLSSEDDPSSETIERELVVGDYTIELAPKWRLVASDAEQSSDVEAVLAGDNPRAFSIVPGETTPVSFRFEVGEEIVPLGSGVVQVGIQVAPRQSGALLITEFMSNPSELADADGEWIELLNPGEQAIELEGCVIERDSTTQTIQGELAVEPGQIVTLANAAEPGFAPDYVYSSLTLPNAAPFTLGIRCAGQLLDSVTVDPSAWPGGAGVAASLSGDVYTAAGNDSGEAWCDALAQYGGDSGTPAELNPVCP